MMASTIERIARWAVGTGSDRFDVRRNGESIESVQSSELDQERASELADQLESAAQADANDRGKRGVYTLHALGDSGEQVCPVKLRITPENLGHDTIVSEVFRQNREMMRMLVQSRRDDTKHFLQLSKLQNERLQKLEGGNAEMLELLDKLRTDELSRTLQRETHDKNIAIKDRFVEAGVPLLAAIANRLIGAPMLPAADPSAVALTEVVRSIRPEQTDSLMSSIPQEHRGDFATLLEAALDGKATVADLKAFLARLSPEQVMGVFACLNMGQQGALQLLLQPQPTTENRPS